MSAIHERAGGSPIAQYKLFTAPRPPLRRTKQSPGPWQELPIRTPGEKHWANGLLQKDAGGRMAMTHITLRPAIVFAGTAPPGADELHAIHHEAHDQCYIANSLKTEVVVAPQ